MNEQDYWDMVDETLDLLQEAAEEWQQLIWQTMRQTVIVDPEDDYPSVEEWVDNIRNEMEDSRRLLTQELKSLKRRYEAMLIKDGKSQFSLREETPKQGSDM